jgi:hypothetical protein
MDLAWLVCSPEQQIKLVKARTPVPAKAFQYLLSRSVPQRDFLSKDMLERLQQFADWFDTL